VGRLVASYNYLSLRFHLAEVETIVNMSQISARPDGESNAAREHWLAERMLDWSGIGVTHLRTTFFVEWFTYRPVALSRSSD
jgi:uncharacterized protein YbjT (DUF2867 family)